MMEQRQFGDHDHEPLGTDDLLSQAIGQWRDEGPAKELWPGVAARCNCDFDVPAETPRMLPISSCL